MDFMPAGELLGATTRVRTITIRDAPHLPDGAYTLLDTYCCDMACDCRKTMIQVHHDRRYVSLINYGWESTAFYAGWYGGVLDAQTLAEMQGPSIALNSPDLVPAHAMLGFFRSILDHAYRDHLRLQYTRFKQALIAKANVLRKREGGAFGNRQRNAPCPCGSGRKLKLCCGRRA